MRCGHCKGEHKTAGEVRTCYGYDKMKSSPMTTIHGGRDGQYELIQKLLAERDQSPLPPYDELKDKINQLDASTMIRHLINNVPKVVKDGH